MSKKVLISSFVYVVFDFDSVEDKNCFEINGSILLHALRNDLHADLKSDINETIGGWITEQLNRMPRTGDVCEREGWRFTVTKIQSHRIERIRVEKIQEDEE